MACRIHSAHRDVSCADDVRFGAAAGTGCPVPGHLRELCLCVTCDTSRVGDHWNRILPQSPHVVQQLCLAAQTTACLLMFRAEFCLVSLALPPKYSGYRIWHGSYPRFCSPAVPLIGKQVFAFLVLVSSSFLCQALS